MSSSPPASRSQPAPWWHWFGTREAAMVILWALCLAYATQRLYHAHTEFADRPDTPADKQRADGNAGHVQIDFGGQWVLGRIIAEGRGSELYHRATQWQVVWKGYPQSAESPYVRRNAGPRSTRDPDARNATIRHDSEDLFVSFMGKDSPRQGEAAAVVAVGLGTATSPGPVVGLNLLAAAEHHLTPELVEDLNRVRIGGPLYPPVHAVLYSPLGLLDPQTAYYLFQALSVGLTFVAGLAVTRLSRGRIWWPAATLVLLLYPGYRSGLDLGQNQVVTLTILLWGWVLATRGRDGWGGVVWGLLAFKPVWAAAFLLAPLLMGRWRFCLAMIGTGIVLGLSTFPIVGIQPWWDWLAVGSEASAVYSVNENWIGLSRDLSGIPRRLLLDFSLPEAERSNGVAVAAGWVLWAAVLGATVAVYLWRGNRRNRTGLGAGFLLLGAYLCCYKFMYYDVLLSAFPLAVLFADPRQFFRPAAYVVRPTNSHIPVEYEPFRPSGEVYWNSFPVSVLALLLLIENWLLHLQFQGTVGLGYYATGEGAARHVPTLAGELSLYQAWETCLLLILWGWCLLRLVLCGDQGEPAQATPRSESSAAPMSGARISDSPTSTA